MEVPSGIIEKPHYYAGRRAHFGPWKRLTASRMSYKAGYRYYRKGVTECGREFFEFRPEWDKWTVTLDS